MPKLSCRDYGFDCDFVAEGEDAAKVKAFWRRTWYRIF